MFSTVERMIAFRYLRARRQEGFISVIAGFSLLGIALGVATLIIVMSVMNGFRAEFLKEILGFNGDLTIYAANGSMPDFDHVTSIVKGVPGVIDATPLVEGQVVAQVPGNWSGVQLRGERVADIAKNAQIASHIVDGSLSALDDDSVMIGERLAVTLGLHAGDDLTLLSPEGVATAFGTVPRVKSYKVAAIFNTGMYQYDSGYAVITLSAAQLFFRQPGRATSLQVFTQDPNVARTMIPALSAAIGSSGQVYDWQGGNSPFLNAVTTERNVMFLILTMIIIVAAFNVISSMIMLVRSKGRDIAILRTMGATQGMVLRIFFLTGASIGVAGTLLGLGLGLAFALNIEAIRQFLQKFTGDDLFNPTIYFLEQLPAQVDHTQIILVVCISFGLSFAATLYPSWRAARLDPVEALRYE